jgi:hypothetical protein
VRLHGLPATQYAENGAPPARDDLPVFVTVLRATLQVKADFRAELAAVTVAVAQGVGRRPGRVPVQYAPPAAGRQAFGDSAVPSA